MAKIRKRTLFKLKSQKGLLILFVFALSIKGYSKTDSLLFFPYRDQNIEIILRYPQAESIKGSVLLLHGWNHDPIRWCRECSLCDSLINNGFLLILPNLGKTTYQEKHYPETRKDYLLYPSRNWIQDTLISGLKKIAGVLDSTKNNFIAGLSTGGRGAALLGLENQNLFKGIIILSSDFDQRLLPNDLIYTGHYGSIKKFPERWSGKDNIALRCDEFRIPLFIAHGLQDKICPSLHSSNFFITLKEKNPNLITTFLIKEGGHDYVFWESCTPAFLHFISALMRK